MKTIAFKLATIVSSCLLALAAQAQESRQHPISALAGSAEGNGVLSDPQGVQEPFAPTLAASMSETNKFGTYTWLMLSTKKLELSKDAGDVAKALWQWCDGKKSAFFAVKLEADFTIHTWYSCTTQGGKKSGMVSSINGLDSVALTLNAAKAKQWQGILKTGEGSCGDAYCQQTGDYRFDVR